MGEELLRIFRGVRFSEPPGEDPPLDFRPNRYSKIREAENSPEILRISERGNYREIPPNIAQTRRTEIPVVLDEPLQVHVPENVHPSLPIVSGRPTPVSKIFGERPLRGNSGVAPTVPKIPQAERISEQHPSSVPTSPVRPTTPLFGKKVYTKRAARRGRQRKKDGDNPNDGTRQLFELWWDQGKGRSFSSFYKGQLSDDMRAYYTKEYVNGANARSKKDYDAWYEEWRNSAARPAVPLLRAVQ